MRLLKEIRHYRLYSTTVPKVPVFFSTLDGLASYLSRNPAGIFGYQNDAKFWIRKDEQIYILQWEKFSGTAHLASFSKNLEHFFLTNDPKEEYDG